MKDYFYSLANKELAIGLKSVISELKFIKI